MRTQTLFLLLILSISTMMLALPASAEEVTITFDDNSNVVAGRALTTQYASEGVTFSGATVVDTGNGDLGFSPSRNSGGVCRMIFNPYVRSVELDFQETSIFGLAAVMDAITVNGQSIRNFDTILNGGHLEIHTRNNDYITNVEVHDFFYLRNIQFDNLRYTPIPEFPTVAVPVAAVLGIMLILQRRKN